MDDDTVAKPSRRSQAGGVLLAVVLTLAGVRAALKQYGALLAGVIRNNQILQALFASSAFGTVSFSLLKLAQFITGWIRAKTFSSVMVTNKDESFDKIIDFIGKQGLSATGALVASTHKKKKTWKDWRREFMLGQRQPPSMEYLPANNNDIHVIYYNGTRIVMQRTKGQTVVAGWERKPMQMETLSLSSWGTNNSAIKALIDDALLASFEDQSANLNVYTLSSGWPGGWEKALSKRPRPLESVILDEDLANDLIADAKHFLSASEWYGSVGIPYRRGYLLYGPPGCGKTSFCQALAGALKLDLCILTLSNKELNDNQLAEHMRDAPPSAIVLLEDVDAVFVDRTVQTGSNNSGVTFSGLLNALDGVASQEGRLFFMTTNHIEKLDPALIRPGRCDVRVELRKASRGQAALLYRRFFPTMSDVAGERFAAALPEYELSMAQLQGYLLEHQGDAESAARHVHKLLLSAKPKDVDRMSIYDHLRRVGLERWAATFEQRGYALKVDVEGLEVNQVRKWSPQLRTDASACSRLGRLLKGDPSLLKDYQLVDMATAKDLFVSTFRDRTGLDLGAKIVARRASSNSESSSAIGADVAQATTLNTLANKLCAALQRNGSSVVSIWQLRKHLRLYADNMHVAVEYAPMLAASAPTQLPVVDDEPVYDWLLRCGLEHHASKFESEGYLRSGALNGLHEGDSLKDLGITDDRELYVLKALIGTDENKTDVLLGFTSPDRPGMRSMFHNYFARSGSAGVPSGSAAHACATQGEREVQQLGINFASQLCDAQGNGRVSRMQVQRYLDTFERGGDAAAAADPEQLKQQLLAPERKPDAPAPTPSVPTEWVHSWLQEHGLEKYSEGFIEQSICTVVDLQREPQLNIPELSKAGVQKVGDQRKILELIKALSPTAPAPAPAPV